MEETEFLLPDLDHHNNPNSFNTAYEYSHVKTTSHQVERKANVLIHTLPGAQLREAV